MSTPANTLPDRTRFEKMYAGLAPWDIGKPQAQFVAALDRVVSPVLDIGCGTGENALFLASRGHQVTGIDFADVAIQRARQKAAERGLAAQFLVGDALALAERPERFASVIDCGLFHVFADEQRRRYVAGLRHVTASHGRLFLMCFSDAEPAGDGPRRVSRQELHDAFADGWSIVSLEPTRFEINPECKDVSFSPGGPKAWFAIIQRKAERGEAPLVCRPAEGRAVGIVGDVYRFLATGADTDGKYALWEAIVPPGGGPPPHIHSREEEGFYVLEGEITITVDGRRIVAGPGTFANLPIGSLHFFKNETNRTARMLISVVPAGLEQMFFEAGQPVAPGVQCAPPPSQEDIQKLLAIAANFGVEIKWV